MKTRKDLYSNEATEILRCLTMYGNIRKEQLEKMFPKTKAEVIDKLIFHLQNNRRIFYDKKTEILYSDSEQKINFDIIYCLWLLCDFAENIEYHSSCDFPVNLVFICDGELYEVSYIPEAKEYFFEKALNFQKCEGKRILILENERQLSRIDIVDVSAYGIVNDNTGQVKYYKKE